VLSRDGSALALCIDTSATQQYNGYSYFALLRQLAGLHPPDPLCNHTLASLELRAKCKVAIVGPAILIIVRKHKAPTSHGLRFCVESIGVSGAKPHARFTGCYEVLPPSLAFRYLQLERRVLFVELTFATCRAAVVAVVAVITVIAAVPAATGQALQLAKVSSTNSTTLGKYL